MRLFLILMLLSFSAFAKDETSKISPRIGRVPFQPSTPQQILKDTQGPWKGAALLELQKELDPRRNYVFWLMLPPKDPMDLRSAEKFRQFLTAHVMSWDGGIGHHMMAWNCRTTDGTLQSGATGMGGEYYGQSREMIMKGYGISTLFSVFNDGIMNTIDEVDAEIRKRSPTDGFAAVGFEVSPEQCESMVGWLHSFINHPSRPYLKYALHLDPEKMEGGGCTSVAVTMLKKAGLFTDVIPLFMRHMEAPRSLLGGNLSSSAYLTTPPQLPWLRGESHKVPMMTFLTTPWLARGEKTASMDLLDPELMLYSLKSIKRVYIEGLPREKRDAEDRKFFKTGLGYRVVVSDDDNEGRLEQPVRRHYPIVGAFDPRIGQIDAATRAWIHSLTAAGQTIRLGMILGHPILILEKR
ncbi:MAG TPA: hypothetical protein VIH99_13300 [Bdellovibrionota bacterium]|jgi:hypothetical protein